MTHNHNGRKHFIFTPKRTTHLSHNTCERIKASLNTLHLSSFVSKIRIKSHSDLKMILVNISNWRFWSNPVYSIGIFLLKETGGLCHSLVWMASMHTPIQILSSWSESIHLHCARVLRQLDAFLPFVFWRAQKNSMGEAKQCLLLTYEMQKNNTGRHFTIGEENKMSERVEDAQTTQHLFTTLAEVQLLLHLLFLGNWTSVRNDRNSFYCLVQTEGLEYTINQSNQFWLDWNNKYLETKLQ